MGSVEANQDTGERISISVLVATQNLGFKSCSRFWTEVCLYPQVITSCFFRNIWLEEVRNFPEGRTCGTGSLLSRSASEKCLFLSSMTKCQARLGQPADRSLAAEAVRKEWGVHGPNCTRDIISMIETVYVICVKASGTSFRYSLTSSSHIC